MGPRDPLSQWPMVPDAPNTTAMAETMATSQQGRKGEQELLTQLHIPHGLLCCPALGTPSCPLPFTLRSGTIQNQQHVMCFSKGADAMWRMCMRTRFAVEAGCAGQGAPSAAPHIPGATGVLPVEQRCQWKSHLSARFLASGGDVSSERDSINIVTPVIQCLVSGDGAGETIASCSGVSADTFEESQSPLPALWNRGKGFMDCAPGALCHGEEGTRGLVMDGGPGRGRKRRTPERNSSLLSWQIPHSGSVNHDP